MSTYQELKGLKIKYLSSDTSGDRLKEGEVFYNSTDFKLKSFVSTAAWHSAGSLLSERGFIGGVGTQTAGLAYGGSPYTTSSEEYNGSGWVYGGNMNTQRAPYGKGGFGILTAAVAMGGYTGTAVTNSAEHYNGTSWTAATNYPGTYLGVSGAGTQTAGLGFGGATASPYPGQNATVEYDGTNWTSGGALNTARSQLGGAGTQTSAVGFGGFPNGPASASNATEEYNGSSWTTVNTMPTASGGMASWGTQTSALSGGGSTPGFFGTPGLNTTIAYDGTNWSSQPNLGTARGALGGAGASNTAGVAFGGRVPSPAYVANTEEFNVSLTATTGASYSSGGNTNNARRNAGCMGTQTAGLYAGGFGPPYLNYSEEYNGTSWTEGNNTTIARECSTSGFGTQTAGAIAGGGAPDNISSPYSGYSNSTDEYNGTSWSEGGDINSARLGMATCGTQTAGFGAGGYQGANHPESPPSNTAKCEQYDGTSWTEVADLNTARSSMGHFGTQTASIACRGNSNPTESWDGSSWTNLPASPIVFDGGNHGGGTQTAGVTYGPRSGNYTEAWDGTTWASSIKYSTSRGGNCAGDASSGLLCGGFTGSGNSNATEEFTGETSAAVAVKTIDFD